jgi:hypothetical protein
MMVRGMESLVVSDEHDLARALPTPNSDSPDQRYPRGEVPVANPSTVVESELFPRRLLATLGYRLVA